MAKIVSPFIGQDVYLLDEGHRYYGVIVEIVDEEETEIMVTFGDDTPQKWGVKELRTPNKTK